MLKVKLQSYKLDYIFMNDAGEDAHAPKRKSLLNL
jgi:hypothetical protein